MAKVIIEVDTDEVMGQDDIGWTLWCEGMNHFLYDLHYNGKITELPDGVSLVSGPAAPVPSVTEPR